MIDLMTLQKAWALLDEREIRNAWLTLSVMVISALSSALMVSSIMPFLSVLADPNRIDTVPALAWAYETFAFESDYAFLVGLGVFSFVVILTTNSIQILRTWVVARYVLMRTHTISHRLLKAYLRQPYAFFLGRHSGDMNTRVLAEATAAVRMFLQPAAEMIAACLTIIALITFLIWVEPTVATVALSLLGGIYAVVFMFNRRVLKRLGDKRVKANQERFLIANEALSGIKDIKVLGREKSYAARFGDPSEQMARTQIAVRVISQVPQFALQAIAFGGLILLCLALLDAEQVNTNSIAPLGDVLPVLGAFAFAGQRLMPELGRVYGALAAMQTGAAAVNVIYDDLLQKAQNDDCWPTAPTALGLRERLDLDGVSYRYPNAERHGLNDISLSIRVGQKIGIVGITGAGKTTLADVILGLLDPTSGQILVDGTPVTPSNLRAWQRSVGYVPQDIFLTGSSIKENIAFGVDCFEIDLARVEQAALAAQLDEFIRSDLPNGYDTAIGERGVRLSGGQRQRIGIARALYHDADLIVFDEATSALDNLTESEVMAAVDALPGDKTVLMIAHRLSTVRRCDRIVVLEKGRVVGCDNWDALMNTNETFQRIAKMSEAA